MMFVRGDGVILVRWTRSLVDTGVAATQLMIKRFYVANHSFIIFESQYA